MVKKWDIFGNIISSAYRKRVLIALEEKPKTPSMLEKELNIKIAHISRTLTELEGLKVISCLTPRLRKGRMYFITKLGKNAMKEINER